MRVRRRRCDREAPFSPPWAPSDGVIEDADTWMPLSGTFETRQGLPKTRTSTCGEPRTPTVATVEPSCG